MSRCLYTLICWTLFSSTLLRAQDEIESVLARFDVEQTSSIVKSVENYLKRFLNKAIKEQELKVAENFLTSLYFVSDATCSFLSNQLVCDIKTKKIVRDIIVENLPASLLEGELKRKLPVQVGYSVDGKEGLASILPVMKSRVETFLKKNGYYGATATIESDEPENENYLDITIKLSAGVFARVNEVNVFGDPPISPRAIKKLFQRMCFSFNRIIESISIGTISCYSRELERDTVQSLQERFAKLGYVQARIRIGHHWVDPHDEDLPRACRAEEPNAVSRCINLRVDVDKGPKVTWTVDVKDHPAINRNAFLRFIGTLFSVDQFSRATVSTESDEVALDHMVIEEDLVGQVTFISAKNIDEQELKESAQAIKGFLVERGYVNAEVQANINQEDAANIKVTFDVYAGDPHFVDSVEIFPKRYQAYVSNDDLEILVPLRSIANNGHLSYKAIDAAREEVERRLHNFGFTDAKVKADLEGRENGKVRVTFIVSSSTREILDEVVVLNGFAEITEVALPTLSNCDHYHVSKRHDVQRKLCHESSLVRSEIEADAQRIEDTYHTHAFLYAKVSSTLEKTPEGNKIIFTLYDSRYGEKSMAALKKQEIRDIIISGNRTTRSSVIRRLFPKTRRSSVLDPIALKKGLANLRESGLFSRIDQKILAGEANSDDVYFLVSLAERPSLTFDTSIAFSTDQLFSLEAELEEANFLSSMLKLNTTLGMGLFWGRQSVFNNKLIWPFMFGKPLRLTVHAPMIVYDDFTHLPNPNTSRRLQSKFSLGLEWRLTARLMPYIRYWLILNQEEIFPNGAPTISFGERIKTLDGLIPTIKQPGTIRGVIKPGISYVALDNPFDPRSGFDMNFWTELSGGPFAGEPPFINIGTQNRFYIPVGPLTIAMQATFMRAFIEPSNDNWRVLRNHSSMDSLGGDRSVRGYSEGHLGIYSHARTPSTYSGYLSNIANVELRFPITTKSSIGNFSGAFFVDQGLLIPCSSLFGCMKDSSFRSIIDNKGFGLSVGFALRYSLPVGPISLDYGVSPITGDNRIHLLFGYAF